MKLLMLNTKSMLVGETEISKGTVNASLVSPRELFIEALKKEIGDTSISPEQMQEAINKAIEQSLKDKYSDLDSLKQQVESVLGKLDNGLSKEQIEQIIKDALNKYENNQSEETISK